VYIIFWMPTFLHMLWCMMDMVCFLVNMSPWLVVGCNYWFGLVSLYLLLCILNTVERLIRAVTHLVNACLSQILCVAILCYNGTLVPLVFKVLLGAIHAPHCCFWMTPLFCQVTMFYTPVSWNLSEICLNLDVSRH
jgi:hypothetical protein